MTGNLQREQLMNRIQSLELQLDDYKKRYNILFNSIKSGVVCLNKDLIIIDANSAAVNIMGLEYEKLVGKSITDEIWQTTSSRGKRISFDQHPVTVSLESGKEIRKEIIQILNQSNKKYRWLNVNISIDYSTPGTEPSGLLVIFEDITQQKKIIEELQQSEEKYRGLIDNSLVGVYQTNFIGDILYANEALAKMLEFDSQFDLMKVDANTMYPKPEKRKAFLMEFNHRKGKIDNYEGKLKTKTGKILNVLVSAFGNNLQVSGMVVDITHLKEAEKALQESEEIYRSFVQNFQGIAFRTRIDWTPEFFHGSVTELTGYTENDFLSRNPDWMDIIYPSDREKLLNKYPINLFASSGFTAEREYRIVKKNGEIKWVHDVIHVQNDEHDKPVYINGAVFDVTTRKQTEEELESIFNISADMICISSLEGYFIKINPAFSRILGYSEEELLQRPFIDFVANEDKEATQKVLKNELRKGKMVINFQNRYICKDGTIKWLDWNSRPLPEKKIIIAVARDITNYKKAEDELKKMMFELGKSNSDLEQFAYIASHDLQEPLRKIKSFSELLAGRYHGQLDEKADHYIDYITGGAARMQNLINDLLQLSRITTRGKTFEPTHINTVLQNVLDNLELMINESGAHIIYERMPLLMADNLQMTQLFQNLISNAIKFRKKDILPEIHIKAKEKKQFWEFEITDNGIGLEMQYAKRIFVIFQRLHTREEYSGTGIGLALCRKIVERHGGEIWVKSKPGEGSKFRFTIRKL